MRLWDPYGTQSPSNLPVPIKGPPPLAIGFEIWIPVKVPYQKNIQYPHKVPYEKLYFRDNFPYPDSVILHARCTIH